MTQRAVPFAASRHPFATTAACVTLFWTVATAGVEVVHMELDPLSSGWGDVASIAVIVVSAWAYTRFCARRGGLGHALGVGVTWLVFGIVAEVAVTARFGPGWYGVVGTPDRPLTGNLVLIVWTFAPAIFARREETR